jgi:hypothetical protein
MKVKDTHGRFIGKRRRDKALRKNNNRTIKLIITALCGLILAMLTSCKEDGKVSYEEPRYIVIEKSDDFELRKYDPYIVAETLVEGDFETVGNEGFRRLFKYISGENRKKESIAMTAPVSQGERYEKIAMTAPVGQEKAGTGYSITFVMPPKYTKETVPEPVDDRITIKEVPSRIMAALTYSGTWSRKRFEEKKAVLKEKIRERGLETTGETVYARYNPPFTPWFLRRNEVLIDIAVQP